MTDHIHDVIGIGFGPSNLALAIALHERQSSLDHLFLEAQPRFAWHPGMMIEGADMQVSFLKDLVSLRDPTSDFSFLSYLYRKGRLERFINRKTFFPSRVEYNDYLAWAAGRLDGVCRYDQRVIGVTPVMRQGRVAHLCVQTEAADGTRSQYLTRQIVLAPGGAAYWPEPFDALQGVAGTSHSKDFLTALYPRVEAGQRIAVIGAGQSASEIFAALAEHPAAPAVDLIQRSGALKPSDDSPFVNEVFFADRVDEMHRQTPETRAKLLQDLATTNYAATDLDLLQHIYGLFYEQDVAGGDRLRLHRDTRVTGAQAVENGIRVTLHGPKGAQTARYDHVILCTGYRRDLAQSVLSGLAGWMTGKDPDRNYRLPMRQGFDAAVHVQGYSETTHGLSDTLLSLLAIRAEEIAKSLEGFASEDALIAAE